MPNSSGGVGETSPHVTSTKAGERSIHPKLNHVQSTHLWLDPKVKPAQPVGDLLKTDDTMSSPATLVYIEMASSSDLDSSHIKGGGDHQGPHNMNNHGAHRVFLAHGL